MAFTCLLLAHLAWAPARADEPTNQGTNTATTPTSTPASTPTSTPMPAAEPEMVGDNGVKYRRKMPMELNLRSRYLTIPDSILDIWYFNSSDPGANPYDRPHARGYAVGLEYVLKPDPTNWTFYAEYAGSTIKPGYWDDVEEPADHNDGEWIQPNGFGLIVAGADYAHEIKAADWVSFVVGGGLGIVIVTGDLTEWTNGSVATGEPDCSPNSAAYERYTTCASDGTKRVPGVLPMVDINAGVRFNLGDAATLRIEGGLHDMIYAGMAVGVAF